MLLFVLWFQDKHAIQVKFTAGNQSNNMAAERFLCVCICCFLNDFIP